MRGSSVASEAAPGLPPPPTTEHLTVRQDSTEGADLDGAAASHQLHLRSAGMIAVATPALPPIVAGMAWYLRPVADRPALLGWVGVHLLLATLLTIAGAVSWRSRRALRPSAVEPAIVWLIGLLGVTVGMSSLVLTLPEGTAQQAMVIQLYVAGVSSSAIMTFGPLARNFMAFAVPANGLNAVGIVAGVNEVPVFLAAVALAYLVVLVGCHHVLASATREAIVGQVRAERLLAHLRIERDRVASANEALRHLAATDPLTGVANRRQFVELLAGALARSRRSGELVAVLFIDLDQFKSLNDTRGHATGDAVLTEAARRMSDAVRAGDVVARRGGDEFTVLLASPASTVDALAVADRIRARLSEPVLTPSGDVQLTASIGLACNDDLGTDAEALMHEADIALYRAKAEGRNRVVALDTEIRRQAAARRADEEDLRRGLAAGEVVAWFQPVVLLGSGAVAGAEALARWQHPTRGLVLPGSFLPMVREHGLDAALQWRMIDDALAALTALRGSDRIGSTFRISVNVDGGRVDLAELADVLAAAALDGQPIAQLVLELTEQSVDHGPAAARALEQIRTLGVAVGLDDFGTGESALSLIRTLPVDFVKIDRHFVRGMHSHRADRAIVASVIELARRLELDVVAEGIESERDAEVLRDLGCTFGQGFLYSKAVPLDQLADVADAITVRGVLDRSNR